MKTKTEAKPSHMSANEIHDAILSENKRLKKIYRADEQAIHDLTKINAALLEAAKKAQLVIHSTWKNLKLSQDGDVAKVFRELDQAITQAEART